MGLLGSITCRNQFSKHWVCN